MDRRGLAFCRSGRANICHDYRSLQEREGHCDRGNVAPGETETVAGEHASVVVFLSGDAVEAKFSGGGVRHDAMQRGEVLNEAAGQRT